MLDLDELLRGAVGKGSSDVHLCEAQPPIFRIHGTLIRQGNLPLVSTDLQAVADQLVPSEKKGELDERGEVDFSYGINGLGRFRVNVYRQRGTLAVALRVIPFKVMTLWELGLPEVLASFCDKPHGLVVVTGPTGSGKSTTLAALIDLINEKYDKHIVTIEDPIEYLHRHKTSVINQREVGSDTTSFSLALRAALRQDPDVILLGEMRDLETINIALQAAETGHLVFATLHTNDAASTIDRIIDVFPAEQQQQVRVQLAGAIQGVVAQRLFKRVDRPGRIAALEIMIATPAVRNLVREGKTHQIPSVIQTSGKLGMKLMEASVRDLYERGIISQEDFQNMVQSQQSFLQQHAAPNGMGNPGRF